MTAAKLCPLWMMGVDAARFGDISAFEAVYGKLFSSGAELNDIFGFAPRVGISVAEQLADKIGGLGNARLRQLFTAELEKERLTLCSGSPGEGLDRILEAKGLPTGGMAELLNLVGMLGDSPEEGLREAVELLKSHPRARAALGDGKNDETPAVRRKRSI